MLKETFIICYKAVTTQVLVTAVLLETNLESCQKEKADRGKNRGQEAPKHPLVCMDNVIKQALMGYVFHQETNPAPGWGGESDAQVSDVM